MAMHAHRPQAAWSSAASVHPEYRQILATYLANLGVELVTRRHARGHDFAPTELAAAVERPRRPACWCSIRTSSAAWKRSSALAEIAHEAGALFVVSVDPISLGLLEAAGRLRGRHRRGRRAIAGQSDGLRRAVPGHHGLPRAVRAPHARPAGRPDGRSPRQALLGADAANPRAAHPPRKGHEQHLHEPRPVRPAGDGLSGADGPARACATWPNCVCKSPATPPSDWRPCRRCRWRSTGRRSRSSSSAIDGRSTS